MIQNSSPAISLKTSAVFIGSLFFIFSAGVLAPRLLAFLPSIFGLGFFTYFAVKQKQYLKIPKAEVILFGLIILLALISTLWSPNKEFPVEKSVKLLIIFIPGLFLIMAARKIQIPSALPFAKGLIAIVFLLLAFLASEKLTDHQIIHFFTGSEVASFKLNRAYVVLSLFMVPCVFFIAKSGLAKKIKIILLSLMTVVTLYAFSLTESQTSQLCLLVGFTFLLLFPVKNKIFGRVLMGLIVVFCLILPFTIGPIKASLNKDMLVNGNYLVRQASIIHRFDVWNYAAEKAIQSPIYGHGIGSLRFMKSDTWMEYQKADSALHAHDAVLQIWAEFGIIGVLLGIALLLYIFRSIERTENPDARRLYLAVFIACFCCSLTGYGVWQSWQLGMFMTVAAFTIFVGRSFSLKEKI
ncbi:MAG TPA: O-antigen ligase family protein [Alphaproteobacteria bacterium]|nr:O-antigen ligase family protein [Alphaproteobacteria bacterium]